MLIYTSTIFFNQPLYIVLSPDEYVVCVTHSLKTVRLYTDVFSETIGQQVKNALRQYEENGENLVRLPLMPITGTLFEQEVWHALHDIPFGQSVTYQDIANCIGRPRSVRAVANAIGKNPLMIIVPCHRVIGKDGKLHGYNGGLSLKRRLLNHENIKFNE